MHQGSYYTLNKFVANENEENNKQKRSELLQQMRNGMSDSSANTITHIHSALREIKLSNEIVAFFSSYKYYFYSFETSGSSARAEPSQEFVNFLGLYSSYFINSECLCVHSTNVGSHSV